MKIVTVSKTRVIRERDGLEKVIRKVRNRLRRLLILDKAY